jgi:hypothetical protein
MINGFRSRFDSDYVIERVAFWAIERVRIVCRHDTPTLAFGLLGSIYITVLLMANNVIRMSQRGLSVASMQRCQRPQHQSPPLSPASTPALEDVFHAGKCALRYRPQQIDAGLVSHRRQNPIGA